MREKKRVPNYADTRVCGCPYWDEHWVVIEGHEDYAVSSCGRIKRRFDKMGTWADHILVLCEDEDGYKCFWDSRRKKRKRVHRLVSDYFMGKIPEGLERNHKDGRKENNCVTNLEYVTQLENIAHATRLGLRATGERNHFCKLTEEQVHKIRELGKSMNAKAVSREMGMPHTTVWQIIARKHWRHI